MAKKTVWNEKEIALQQVEDAKENYQRAEMMFKFAEPDFFEIANMELTIAEMQYKVAMMKLQKICGQEGPNPQRALFFAVSEF